MVTGNMYALQAGKTPLQQKIEQWQAADSAEAEELLKDHARAWVRSKEAAQGLDVPVLTSQSEATPAQTSPLQQQRKLQLAALKCTLAMDEKSMHVLQEARPILAHILKEQLRYDMNPASIARLRMMVIRLTGLESKIEETLVSTGALERLLAGEQQP